MKINELVQKFEAEAEDVRRKMDGLKERADFLDDMLKELRGATGGGRRRGTATPAEKKPRAGGGKKRGPRRKGGVTVKDAILKAVAGASEPLTAGEIIARAKAESGGKENSIRTQINNLAKSGHLAQVEHGGRGYKYRIGAAGA